LVIPRGTLLNTATVAVGALIGWAVGRYIPISYRDVVIDGLGLVTVGIGLKMFLEAKVIFVVAFCIAIGGMIGQLLGIETGINAFANWAKEVFHAQNAGHFAEAIVTTSILFCVGPITLLGCIQDAIENRIDLLAIKSTLDGLGAIFFAATLGPGVLVTAGVVLVFQSVLTFCARPLQPLAKDPELLSEVTGVGGIMMMAIGISSLLKIIPIPTANYLPALFLAPLSVTAMRKFRARRTQE